VKGKEEWFIGGVTDENAREATLSFDFLPSGKKYTATIYADAKGITWKKDPQKYTITKVSVTSKSKMKVPLAAGGGVAVSIR
jgi:hypothetical protein